MPDPGPWDKYAAEQAPAGQQPAPGPWQKYGGLMTQPGQKPAGPAKAELSDEAAHKVGDAALSALPYAGAAAAGLFTGGVGFIPAVGAAMAGGGIGGLIEETGREITGLKPAKTTGEFAKRVGIDTVEQGLNEAGGRAVGGILSKTVGKYFNPEKLYQSALKPPGADQIVAQKAVRAGIDEGVPLSEGARTLTRSKITALNSQIETAINGTPANIPPSQWVSNVTRKLDVLRNRFSKVAGSGPDFVKEIDGFERDFLLQTKPDPIHTIQMKPSKVLGANGQPVMTPTAVTIEPEDMTLPQLRQQAKSISAKDAQEIKKSTYEAIRIRDVNAYTPGKSPKLQVRMEQDVARSMKEELEQIYPQIKSLNQREGALIELDKAIGRYVKREANKQITPYFIFPVVGGMLGHAAGGAAGAAEGSAAGAAGAAAADLMRRVLEDPEVKSKIAIALDRAAKSSIVSKTGKVASRVLTPANAARAAEYAVQQ